jgi:hypothetical protein
MNKQKDPFFKKNVDLQFSNEFDFRYKTRGTPSISLKLFQVLHARNRWILTKNNLFKKNVREKFISKFFIHS